MAPQSPQRDGRSLAGQRYTSVGLVIVLWGGFAIWLYGCSVLQTEAPPPPVLAAPDPNYDPAYPPSWPPPGAGDRHRAR